MNKSRAISYIRLAVVSLMAGLLAGTLGNVVFSGRQSIGKASDMMEHFMETHGWLLMLIGCMVYVVIELIFYYRIKKFIKKMETVSDEEADGLDSQIDCMQNDARLINGIFQAIFFSFFALVMPGNPVSLTWQLRTALICVVFCGIFSSGYEIWVVRNAQKRDPSKRGNPTDFNFNRVWLESCDEGERLLIYKAGYETFSTMQWVFVVLWGLTFIVKVYLSAGNGPIIIVGAVWVIQSCVYWYQLGKLRRSKLE